MVAKVHGDEHPDDDVGGEAGDDEAHAHDQEEFACG
jgi:hypothetical protein